ncbi:PREDICTED: progesterone receptor [Condylura cristata]|uniref:progesterone receptor n=1 Tax=Condylura cristata TaxID=143302 RepID=UPI0006431D29|nr:PREDICTED: progesterone receptor [Condylura cristata]
MTEPTAKDPRAPHVAGGAPSPTRVRSPPLGLGRADPGPFPASADTSPAVPLSLEGLLLPRPCPGRVSPDAKTLDRPPPPDVGGAYPRVEAPGGASGGSARAPDKDGGLLDSVLDTLLAPSGRGPGHASPPACEGPGPWPDSEASQSPQYSFESLPQKICLICGDEASGCHYGVLTCGSCKVFFKRAMEGRKFKKFNKVRVMRALDAVGLPQPVAIPGDGQALGQRISFSPSQDIQLVPPLINLLLSIEPDVVYAGHDNSKPDTSSSLLTSLNQLGERQLLSVVKWSKSLPGFRNLHIDDQITLIQYSWMSLMVFGLGWRSYKHVSGQMLYFAPDLILNESHRAYLSFKIT